MTTIFIIRHGRFVNPNQIIPLRLPDYHLSGEGHEQIALVSAHLKGKNITKVFSSPVDRCLETAEIISGDLGFTQVIVDQRLIELGSPYQGITKGKFKEQFFDKCLYDDPLQKEKGETAEVVIARMQSFLDWVLDEYKDQAVVVVSHGDPIMLLEYALTGKDYCGLMEGVTTDYIPMSGHFEWQFEGNKLAKERRSWSDV